MSLPGFDSIYFTEMLKAQWIGQMSMLVILLVLTARLDLHGHHTQERLHSACNQSLG